MTRDELLAWAGNVKEFDHMVYVGKNLTIKDVKLAVQALPTPRPNSIGEPPCDKPGCVVCGNPSAACEVPGACL